jgi:hypothetical protein
MLFHVTAKHSVNDCNLYNREVKQALQEFLPSIPSLCEELKFKRKNFTYVACYINRFN